MNLSVCLGKVIFLLFIFPISSNVFSQTKTDSPAKWSVTTSAVLAGSSDLSDPSGYTVYGALSFEPSVERKLSKVLSICIKFRFESHEIDYQENLNSEEVPLGSVELTPVNLLIKYSIPFKHVHPYLAGGGNATFCWEKSGALNSTDLSPSLGAALAFGVDVDISSFALFNFNVGWNSLRTDITENGVTVASLTMDPVSVAAGFGFKF